MSIITIVSIIITIIVIGVVDINLVLFIAIVQELERIKAEMAAIQHNPDLSQDDKKNRGEVKMRELYSASGNAKVKGAVEQVERALDEGELKRYFCNTSCTDTNMAREIMVSCGQDHEHWMGLSTSWAMYVRPCAMTAACIRGKLPLACLAGGKVIVIGYHHKVLDRVEMCIASSLYHGSCMHCRQQGDCVWTPPQGAGWHSAEAGQSLPGDAH